MASVGLTGVGDAGIDLATFKRYQRFADEGKLSARINAMIGGTGKDFDAISKGGPLVGYGHDFLSVRSVKLFADGALGSRGAAMLMPYSDDAKNSGLLFSKPDEMTAMISKAFAHGYQVCVHAIGDKGNREVLDSFAASYKKYPDSKALRNRIEHAQVVSVDDIPRFVDLNLIASMQPTHATSDMNMAEDRVGPERIKGAYAWRTFLKQGTRIAGGSDFPVESPNPPSMPPTPPIRKTHSARWNLASGPTSSSSTATSSKWIRRRSGIPRCCRRGWQASLSIRVRVPIEITSIANLRGWSVHRRLTSRP